MMKNKEEADKLLKELKRNIYNKNLFKDCIKCNICDKDFKNYDILIKTKCQDSFHEACFKNFIYTNIIYAECPKCNEVMLGERITKPEKLENTLMFTDQNNPSLSFTNLNL